MLEVRDSKVAKPCQGAPAQSCQPLRRRLQRRTCKKKTFQQHASYGEFPHSVFSVFSRNVPRAASDEAAPKGRVKLRWAKRKTAAAMSASRPEAAAARTSVTCILDHDPRFYVLPTFYPLSCVTDSICGLGSNCEQAGVLHLPRASKSKTQLETAHQSLPCEAGRSCFSFDEMECPECNAAWAYSFAWTTWTCAGIGQTSRALAASMCRKLHVTQKCVKSAQLPTCGTCFLEPPRGYNWGNLSCSCIECWLCVPPPLCYTVLHISTRRLPGQRTLPQAEEKVAVHPGCWKAYPS